MPHVHIAGAYGIGAILAAFAAKFLQPFPLLQNLAALAAFIASVTSIYFLIKKGKR